MAWKIADGQLKSNANVFLSNLLLINFVQDTLKVSHFQRLHFRFVCHSSFHFRHLADHDIHQHFIISFLVRWNSFRCFFCFDSCHANRKIMKKFEQNLILFALSANRKQTAQIFNKESISLLGDAFSGYCSHSLCGCFSMTTRNNSLEKRSPRVQSYYIWLTTVAISIIVSLMFTLRY